MQIEKRNGIGTGAIVAIVVVVVLIAAAGYFIFVPGTSSSTTTQTTTTTTTSSPTTTTSTIMTTTTSTTSTTTTSTTTTSTTTTSTTTTSTTSTTTTSSVSASPANIIMPAGVGNNQQLNFSPVTATVYIGINNTIIFTNDDTVVHNVDWSTVPTGSTLTAGTTSVNLKNGQTYTVTLTTPGTYTYACDYHSWMRGTIVVMAAP